MQAKILIMEWKNRMLKNNRVIGRKNKGRLNNMKNMMKNNMEKSLCKKAMVIGIIILFVGASVIPSMSGNIKGINNDADDSSSEEKVFESGITDVSFEGFSDDGLFLGEQTSDKIDDDERSSDTAENDDFSILAEDSYNESGGGRSYDWPTFQHDMQRTGFTNGVGEIDSPSIKWRYTSDGFSGSPAIGDIDDDGDTEVVFGCSYGTYAFDGSTGVLEWGNAHDATTAPAIGDVDDDGEIEVIVGSSIDHNVYCLDGATGNDEWSYAFDKNDIIYASPTIGDVDNDGETEVIMITGWEDVYCLDGATGNEEWFYDGNGESWRTCPSIYDVDGDNYMEIFVGSKENGISCLNGYDGSEKWKTTSYHTGLESIFSLDDVDDDGDVELVFDGVKRIGGGNSELGVYCLDADTGQMEWEFVKDIGYFHPAIGDVDDDGEIEVVCSGAHGLVYCLDGATGNEEWNYSSGVGMSPPALGDIDGDGKIEIVLGCNNGRVYCLSGENGMEQWNFLLGDIARFPPALGDVDDDGKIEIAIVTYNHGAANDHVYVLDNDFGPQPPVVIMNGPYRASVGEEIQFDASESYDPDGSIVGYRWDWTNDGMWDTEWLSNPITTHAYDDAFNGTVRLEVKDNENLTTIETESVRIDATPPIIWNKTYDIYKGGYSVQQTFDGGYIITGGYTAVVLLKTDSNGNTEWLNYFDVRDGGNKGYSVQQTNDRGFIITGYTSSEEEGCDVFLIKTDEDGNEQWNKTFGSVIDTEFGESVIQTSDGGYAIAGWTDGGEMFLIKTDSYGENEEWYTLGNGLAMSVLQSDDDGYVVGGGCDGKACIIKTFSNGDIDWKRNYPFTVHGWCISHTSDDGYVLTGYGGAFLVKTDSNGNEEWNKTFDALRGFSVEQTSDGGYVIGAQYNWAEQSCLIKTDENGTLEWRKIIEGSSVSSRRPVARQTFDGGYILLTSKGGGRIWLIKFGWVPPTAEAGGPYYSNPGYPVQFDGTDSYDNDENGQRIVRYDWKFFDEDSWHNDTGPTPQYNYTSVGNYTVTLRVFDDEGDNDTDSDPVYIDYQPHPPTAEAGGPYSGMEDDDPIEFNASSSHDNDNDGCCIVRYDWKFYDGDTWHNDLGSSPTHIYNDEGDYIVTVRIHDDEGFTDTDTASVHIDGYYPPTADAGNFYTSMEDDPIVFDASGSHDNDEDGCCIVRYDWKWYTGDTWHNDTGPTPTHTYYDEGDYTVYLRVWDDENVTSIDTAVAYVEGYYPPTALPGGPYYGITNEPVQFDGSNSHDNDEGGNSITTYEWKFYEEDNWHNLTATPTHTYTNIGVYNVALRVTDDEGETDTRSTTAEITTYYDPTADAGGPYNGVAYSPVTFDGSGSFDNDEGGCCITGYRWDWTNDGSWDTSWLSNPVTTHTYNSGFNGLVRLQVRDNDGAYVGYGEDTADITIASQPPTADFTVQSTNNPSIFKFDGSSSIDPRPGHNYRDLYYRWDFNNDGNWDKTGSYSSAGVVTWSYPSSGTKTIKLQVENPDGSDTYTDSVYAFNYGDITVHCSNPNFFLSYPGSSIPPLKNRYWFTTSSGVFTKVTFQIGSDVYTDTTGDYWEGILKMSRGSPGDSVIIKGYSGSSVVWTETLPAWIIITPSWFVTFLGNSFPSINHYNNHGRWVMDVHPVSCGLEFGMPNVPGEHTSGDYNFDGSISMPDWFRIDSSKSLTITQNLVSGSFGVGMELGSHSIFGFNAGAGFSADANVEINSREVVLVGWISIQGSAGVSFSVPIFVIPFIADAGLTGGIDGFIGVGFEVVRFASDGFTFCPGRNAEVYLGLGVHFGVYGQVLFGLGRLEGGLYCDGKLTMKIPSRHKLFNLKGGGYVKASAFWGAISKKWKFPVVDISMSLDKGFRNPITNNGTVQCWESRNMDLLCLKDFDRGSTRLGGRGVTVLRENVGETAVPKIVLTDSGEGIAVWSDITLVGDGFQSDIYWSVYDGSSWGAVENTSTSGRCEFDPELALVNDGLSEHIVLTFLAVDHVINETTDPDTFYAGSRIHTALWNKDDGWSFEGENLLIYGGTVNTRSMTSDSQGSVYMTYLVDSDCDPWESGIGSIYVVNGNIAGDEVDWDVPVLVRSFDDMSVGFSPKVSFVDSSVGGIVYSRWNESLLLNETVLVPTVSGVDGFSDLELVLNSTNLSVGYISSVTVGDDIIVFWVENHSRICRTVVDTDPVLSNWDIGDTEIVYSSMSVISLKPISFDEKQYLLFQQGEDFIPFVLEKLPGDVWGNLRQVSLENRFSLGQVDGASNAICSQMIYLRDTSLMDWLVGRWRFNEGNGTNVSDSSGCGNDGVLVGNTSWFEYDNESLDPIYGYYLRFNGSSDYVEVPYNSGMIFDDEFTSTGWIRLNSTSAGSTILGVDSSWQLREVNGELEVKLWRTDGLVTQSGVATLPVDTWIFIGVTYNNGVLRISVRPNGLDNTSAMYDLGDYSIVDSGNPLIIGGFVGCTDEVWVFSRDISMSEVDSIWFTLYAILGSLHDVVVQYLPSFASFSFGVSGKRGGNVTTEDVVEFTGEPSGFDFEWDFGDGIQDVGEVVSHQYDTRGIYEVVCEATDPSTGVTTPVTQTITVIDTTPPVFSGLESVVTGSCNATLNWSPAIDTSPFVMYYGFMRNESEVFNFSSPCFVTDDTSYVVLDLVAGETYYFVVRAVDAAGNMEDNMVELSTAVSDTSPPVFNGLTGLYELANQPDSVLLEWDEAVDNSPPIMYHVYMSNVSGGQNFSDPLVSTDLSWSLIGGLDLENESYYFVVRAEDAWGNEDNNTIELSTLTVICGDVTDDGEINLGDVVFLINYLYRGGIAPDPVCIGDVTCNTVVDLGDVVKLINYLYRGGDPPCEDCCSPPW